MNALSRVAIFVEVAKQRSFAGAARELGLTPSAVSKQVQNLEQALTVKLLTRTTRSVTLTEEGALYFERASRAIADLDEAADLVNELRTTPRGNLKVSLPTTIGMRFLLGPIAEFARQYPEVILDVQFEDRLIDIHEEGFDVVLRIAALPDSTLAARKLADSPVQAFCSKGYIRANGKPDTPEDLVGHNVLAYTRNRGAHEWRYLGPDGATGTVGLQSSFKCDFAEMMIEAACQGIGIIICPRLFVTEEVRKGKLVPLLQDYESNPPRSLYAVFPANRYMSSRLRLFLDYMRDCFSGR
jgi:DNA-binding transcriptional LysR family regulator